MSRESGEKEMRWEGVEQDLGHQRQEVMSGYMINNNDNPGIMGRNGSKNAYTLG